MTQKDLNNWIMYHEIQKLKRLGFSSSKIAQYLVMDARTVGKYASMNESEYEQFLLISSHRTKSLEAYETFVFEKLSLFQDSSAAQLHDWLKEHHPDFPKVTSRTVYNFVMFVRQKHNIPFMPHIREYFPVEELPYGEQSQVDFGDYNMLQSNGKRKKVKFFAMVLSRSRMKFVWFLDKPFTSGIVVLAHEKAFEFFDGVPRTIVYDQDRTIIVDENIGEIILTATFKQYTKSRSFNLHFCRKSDPESKGKIENVIQYVKKNFLYNRIFSDAETLNQQAIAWLNRTANYLEHNYTKKSPQSEYLIEKPYLNPFTPITIEIAESNLYHVRKNNIISYKSSFYTLPTGTYQGTGTQVRVKEIENTIQIYSLKQEFLGSHMLSNQKGETVTNTNHRRDTSKSIDQMIDQTSAYFTDVALALDYLNQIRAKLPRYTRDHLQMILKALKDSDQKMADKTLHFCFSNSLFSGNDWAEIYHIFQIKSTKPEPIEKIALLNKANLIKAEEKPQTRNIEDYEKIINH